MGLGPIWRLRDAADAADSAVAGSAEHVAAASAEPTPPAAPDIPSPVTAEPPVDRRDKIPASPAPEAEPETPAVRVADAADLDWDTLTRKILACRECALCEQRTQAVPGVGDREADWLFVGEGPGAEEDARGEPFVGKAGKLLDAMLAAIDLARGDNVYIANAVKCRPPMNRTPEPAELAACFPYLARQIALIRPRLIVALGRPAAQALLNTDIRIASARGRCFDYQGIPVIVTYHPAYLLRNPLDKAKAWEDLCFARRQMRERLDKDNA
ncbi:uracil-DNA glycosylase [Denitromonas sp. IR12]|uniref:Type-4 uracil-DNA glycosylase n=2 Tax=Denitromonas iodatirespirans TaxID=2795389 RepID=A0A944D984_DENI1|nr:uracil-DNA glycosylase [Denitromonas iodatirespirans]